MVMMIGQQDALGVLTSERRALLRTCIDRAWTTYVESFLPFVPLCSPRGQANMLHELVIQEVRGRLADMPGVSLLDGASSTGRFLVVIDGKLVLQFRKLTQDFRTTNNPTNTSESFDNQETGLDGMPDIPRVTVGYKLTHYGTAIEGAYLAFVMGKECVWHHDLIGASSSIEIDFPRRKISAADDEQQKKDAKQARRNRRKASSSENGVTDIGSSGTNDGE